MLKFFKSSNYAEAQVNFEKALEYEHTGDFQKALEEINGALQKIPDHQMLLIKRYELSEKIAGNHDPINQLKAKMV